MAKIVEPPVLLSRILTFVLATSVVVLGTMVFTLIKMIPLERPEVFFLYTPTRSVNVVIDPLIPNADNQNAVYAYQRGFVREYVIARNTLSNNPAITRKNWSRIVQSWSSKDIYSKFIKTRLYNDFTLGEQRPTVSCSVNFDNDNPVFLMAKDTYHVKFTWVCENIGGQTTQKNYTIQIKIKSELSDRASVTLGYLEKLRDNPLGIQVVQYNIIDGRGDPLDSDIASW